ncbi:SgcJ/EcaC family oxidoreductase [Rhizobium jaguaris]|uniref:SgcJ/EcaC family oxidoreductase n=1 Tax=Rhizobium jaguaris TaxID=1312183 RepID=A0A387G163_9HYPH|nr:SgcJ/EcaC family oxidoreductase [Rhizobium jaguaris]AYG61941.1 SgcJ/EcaC family oxidoreductase [Rhizobium jaguaris]
MHKLVLVAAFASFIAGPAWAVECTPITKKQVEGLFDRWNASLATLDPQKVVENYAPDAVLLPTLSNKPRVTQEERKAYFKDFLKKKPQGKIDSRTIRIGCNKVTDTGLYTFTMADGTKVPARYTFTYEVEHGKWLIASHHSSAMPEHKN